MARAKINSVLSCLVLSYLNSELSVERPVGYKQNKIIQG